jgi:hypothetical protein
MSDTTITSANSVFTITIPGLFPAPVQLQGYSAEKAWSTDTQELAEIQIGVDGRSTGGYTPALVPQTISLQADSPSKIIFTTLAAATKARREIYYIGGAISLPATGETFICKRGILKGFKSIPDAAKVLQPMEFQIVWEDISSTLL